MAIREAPLDVADEFSRKDPSPPAPHSPHALAFHSPPMSSSSSTAASEIVLCPGQGAQAVGMGKSWFEQSDAARRVFSEADAVLRSEPGFEGRTLSELCFGGPADRLNQTDVSQPAIYVVSVACLAALRDAGVVDGISVAAGLSLGEYTALHLAGAFSFADGLRLVARRGALMQEAALASKGGMVALIGADEAQAAAVCEAAAAGDVLVAANFNAPGQIVLSGSAAACERAVKAAGESGYRATLLQVAGAFHSPLMQFAADRMGEVLAKVQLEPLQATVFSNVTAEPHPASNPELLRQRLVEQIVRPVRWAETCARLAGFPILETAGPPPKVVRELAPGTVLKGLMRRIDRSVEVINHDQPQPPPKPVAPSQP